jgi:hypothetical protein
MVRKGLLLLAVIPLALAGCASIDWNSSPQRDELTKEDETQPGQRGDDTNKEKNGGDSEKAAKPSKTLLEWAVPTKGGKEEKEKNSKQDDGAEQGNDNGGEPERRLDPDRPHLPEAASTVGLGRVILESGYTYTSKGQAFLHQHSYPEALLRVGMLADWFEFRITQNVINQKNIPGSGQPTNTNGAQDLEIGMKLGLTEQKDFLPETALILQTSVPSGSSSASNDTVLPGVNLDMGWEIVKDRFGMETVTSANGARDDAKHTYVNFVQGITVTYDLTSKLEEFTEYDLFVPIGAASPEATHPQHYIVAGFVYFLNNDLEVDIRAGVGLNQHASDYLLGTGFAARY